MIALIFSLVLHVAAGESINAALDSARTVYTERGERTTVLIEPGTYQEELTIDTWFADGIPTYAEIAYAGQRVLTAVIRDFEFEK